LKGHQAARDRKDRRVHRVAKVDRDRVGREVPVVHAERQAVLALLDREDCRGHAGHAANEDLRERWDPEAVKGRSDAQDLLDPVDPEESADRAVIWVV